MSTGTPIRLIFLTIFLISLSSCYKLQSDEELRKDIVGTWKKVDCKYPYVDDKEVTEPSHLMPKLSLSEDGVFNEFGLYAYCCSTDCDTSYQGTCTWLIEDGKLVIVPAIVPNGHVYLNRPYQILALKKNTLVFDDHNIGGVEFKKTCYCRE